MTASSWTMVWMAMCLYGKVRHRLTFPTWSGGFVSQHFISSICKRAVFWNSSKANKSPNRPCLGNYQWNFAVIKMLLQPQSKLLSFKKIFSSFTIAVFLFVNSCVGFIFCSQVRTLTQRSANQPWKWLRNLLKRRTTPIKHRYTASMSLKNTTLGSYISH